MLTIANHISSMITCYVLSLTASLNKCTEYTIHICKSHLIFVQFILCKFICMC